ncbi:hypothetical protein BKA70DRAFT_1214204 [Coprinopsis sp. MPI-PUGE-AT-0042]|nr:hypothetical protein BKA70DRAFT_1214204 [Coprinopsis sp. MPI-PUGE-AT-0042]
MVEDEEGQSLWAGDSNDYRSYFISRPQYSHGKKCPPDHSSTEHEPPATATSDILSAFFATTSSQDVGEGGDGDLGVAEMVYRHDDLSGSEGSDNEEDEGDGVRMASIKTLPKEHGERPPPLAGYRVRMNTVDAFRVAGGVELPIECIRRGLCVGSALLSPVGQFTEMSARKSIPDHESHSKATRDHVKMVDVFRVVEACKVMNCHPKASSQLDVANQLWRWVERADRLKAASALGGIVDHTVANTEQTITTDPIRKGKVRPTASGKTAVSPQRLMGEWPPALFHASLEWVQDVPDEINQMPGSGNGIYGSTGEPAPNRFRAFVDVAYLAIRTHMECPPPSRTAHRTQTSTPSTATMGWLDRTGSLAMPSPFDTSNAPTHENAHEDLPSAGLDSHGYSQQGIRRVLKQRPAQSPSPSNGRSVMNRALTGRHAIGTICRLSCRLSTFANLNLPDFTYNEPDGLEGSAEMIAQHENNNMASNGGSMGAGLLLLIRMRRNGWSWMGAEYPRWRFAVLYPHPSCLCDIQMARERAEVWFKATKRGKFLCRTGSCTNDTPDAFVVGGQAKTGSSRRWIAG